MTPEEREQFDSWVGHHREATLRQMNDSAIVMSLAPPQEWEIDLNQALEIGLCLLLDKPLLVVAWTDRELPEKLRRVADEVVFADIDTEEGKQLVAEAVKRLVP